MGLRLDLVKTATFAVLHFGVGFAVAYLLTGSVAISAGVALIEPAVNTVVFFFHEKAWRRFGRACRGSGSRRRRLRGFLRRDRRGRTSTQQYYTSVTFP